MSQSTYNNPFIELADRLSPTEFELLELPGCDHFSPAGHLWRREECEALAMAMAARRPLLVRGEAGTGKSQLARAAAQVLNGPPPLVEVIHPRFEALDLLYRFDVVRRLADAQAQRLKKNNTPYVEPGCLWQAFKRMQPEQPLPVLLIDEIDKADADVPNALLDVLGNRAFNVAPLNNRCVRAPEGRLPLIIITTNEERELPAAFVRRCVVLNLNPPSDEGGGEEFMSWLETRGRAHRHLQIAEPLYRLAARQVLADRRETRRLGYPPVGLAEYIDLLSALHDLSASLSGDERSAHQQALLSRLSRYVLVKNAQQDQSRPALESA